MLRAAPLLSLLLLGIAVPGSSARVDRTAHAGSAGVSICHGRAKRLRSGYVSFSFTCGESQDVTGFLLRANRPVHRVEDPSEAFGCERRTYRSFHCEDIHSGAGSVGSGVVSVSEPYCRPHEHLVLRVSPSLNFEGPAIGTFMLKGPC